MAQYQLVRVPPGRIRSRNSAALRPDGAYVLYWMIAARRATWNYALDRAIELARELNRPLVVLEALRADYPWASDRFHRFVLAGMADNTAAFAGTGVLYYPYVESNAGAGAGLLETLAAQACVVVTDEFPAYFLHRMVTAVAPRLSVPLESVDSNGVLPIWATERVFARAFDFRRFLQKELRPFLTEAPNPSPLRDGLLPPPDLPAAIVDRWPKAILTGGAGSVGSLPIDHGVSPVPYAGGALEGTRTLERFLSDRLACYGDRSHPDSDSGSGLSPYLHFGHISAHQVFHGLAEQEGWSTDDLSRSTSGKREGWWGMSPAAESFLDELVTWRELGLNFCAHRDDYDRYESLPGWARATLDEHSADPRPHVYSISQFEAAETHDDLWNAAQRQLRVEGRIHNYLRMLWGKKILHWSESPRDALHIMIELNNKYAVDGRDPNSFSGIFWVLGRYDRPWGPERAVFGKIRYMTSANTRRKLRVKEYLARWSRSPDQTSAEV